MTQSVAIVTGAAGDIGRGHRPPAWPMTTMSCCWPIIDAEAAAEVAPKPRAGERFVALACDVTDARRASPRWRSARRGSAWFETLVNNAGAARAVSLHDTTPEIWRADNALNLEAAFLCFRAVEDMLKASKGSLVNIASVNGMHVFGHPAYSAAKAGLLHFTRLIAVEYGKFGIRANAVAPGTVRTQAWEVRAAANPNVFEEARRWYPLQRVVDPDDVANAVGLSRRPAGRGHHRRLPAGRLRPDGRPGRARPHLLPIRPLLKTSC